MNDWLTRFSLQDFTDVADPYKNVKDYKNVKTRARWLLVGQNEKKDDSSMSPDKTGGKGHGTCMLSIVCGAKYGVAKSVEPVIVRVPGGNTMEDWLEGISKVHDDVLERNDKTKKSVLLMAFYFPEDAVNTGWIIRARMLIKSLVDDFGVLPVTGSGNGGLNTITGFPASYAKKDIPELVVAGAVDNTGEPWAGNNKDTDLPFIYAPGNQVHCASAFKGEEVKLSRGTSDAAASTAALAAYFWSLSGPKDYTPANMKSYLRFLAYPRKKDVKILGVYNGFHHKNGDAPGFDCVES